MNLTNSEAPVKTFKIFAANNKYIIVARTPSGNRSQTFDHYPINAINVLLNIGYSEAE